MTDKVPTLRAGRATPAPVPDPVADLARELYARRMGSVGVAARTPSYIAEQCLADAREFFRVLAESQAATQPPTQPLSTTPAA